MVVVRVVEEDYCIKLEAGEDRALQVFLSNLAVVEEEEPLIHKMVRTVEEYPG